MLKSYLTRNARAEILEIRSRGEDEYGERFAIEYDLLIKQAIKDIQKEPYSPVVRKINKDLHVYPIQFSKKNIDVNVKNPAHSVLYFTYNKDTLIVASVCRESRQKHISGLSKRKAVKEMKEKDRDDGMEM